MSERSKKLRFCPEVRNAIAAAKRQIPEKGAQVVVCPRCNTQFDVTASGAYPLVDFCPYGESQLHPGSNRDGF